MIPLSQIIFNANYTFISFMFYLTQSYRVNFDLVRFVDFPHVLSIPCV